MSRLQRIALVAAILTLIGIATVILGFWQNESDQLGQAARSES